MRELNVFSGFDGMSCGRESLNRANKPVNKYFSSEIDESAIQVAMKNYPDIIQIGDISKIKIKTIYLSEVYRYIYSKYFNNDIQSLQSFISEREMLYRIYEEQSFSAYFGAQKPNEIRKISPDTTISINDRIWFWSNPMGSNTGIFDIIRSGKRRKEPNIINVGELCKHSFWWNGYRQLQPETQRTCITGNIEKNIQTLRKNKRKNSRSGDTTIFNKGSERTSKTKIAETVSRSDQKTELFGCDVEGKSNRICREKEKNRRNVASDNVFEIKKTLYPENEDNRIIETDGDILHVYPKIQITVVECEWGVIVFKGTFDIALSGSPCQSLSFAGKRKGMTTKNDIIISSLEQYLNLKENGFEFDGQSYLFWEFIRILKDINPTYFLQENTLMNKKWSDIMSGVLGIEPQMINSALVSAQNRKRFYWTNIPYTVPEDRNIFLSDIIVGAIAAGIHGRLNKSTGKYEQHLDIDPLNHGKANCITTAPSTTCKYLKGGRLHNITALEGEMLQTLTAGYTNLPGLCKTKRLKMIGNGWTPELIAHIFSGINIY